MKLQKVVALLFVFVSVFITGCETSSESPENLLSDNIIYDKSKNELYTFVNKSLDGTTLILPQNSSQVGQINELNSNIIAFQKKEDVNLNSNEVGFVIISKQKNGYMVEDSFLQEGDEIQYANFYDLNNDGLEEVILLINNKNCVTMNIYSVVNNEIKKTSEIRPTWLDDYQKYTNMKINVGLINDDSKLDILMLNSDNSSSDVYITVLNYDKDYNVKVTNSVKMSNIKNISESYITLGKVYNNKKGVILSMPMLKDNNYGTQILYMKDDKLKKVFKDDKIIMNSYYVPAIDVNNDGILEIPELNNSMIENFNPNSKSSSLVSWRKWNNKVGDEANTIFISQVYYNYKSNFKFLVPNNLANKLYIKRSVLGDSNYYIFYYYDKEHSKQIELFQIGYSPKNLVEDAKASPKIESILYENNNYYYQLIVKDKEAFEKYNLTLDNMKEYFSIIYK